MFPNLFSMAVDPEALVASQVKKETGTFSWALSLKRSAAEDYAQKFASPF